MHVVADANTNVPVDPLGDIETIDLELIMADLEMVNRRVEKATKMAKGDKKFLHEVELFSDLAKHLDAGKSARTFEVSKDDAELIATAELLSLKPIIYAANMDEDGFANQDGNQYLQQVKELAEKEGAQVLPICAKLEQDFAELDGEDRAMFLEELGIQESGLDRLIKCSYALLGLISFLTYGEDECRAWTIKNGTKAPQAAGKIHSDIERGFIRAETINFSEMIACGSVAAAKEKGLLRSEGKREFLQSLGPADDFLLVDGYNILFAWDELKELARTSLDTARHVLKNLLCKYQGYRGCTLILVFDAYKVPQGLGSVEKYHNIHIVYTRQAETADQYIERLSFELRGRRRVRVATSDNLEQLIILGHGAERISAQHIHVEVYTAQVEIERILAQNNQKNAK